MTPAARYQEPVRHDPEGVYAALADLDRPCYAVSGGGRIGATSHPPAPGSGVTTLAAAAPQPPGVLGSGEFRRQHGVRHAYMAGAMAGGISGEDLVIAMSRAGYLAAFGAAGLPEARIDKALSRLANELGTAGLPYACNLIHSPTAPDRERACVDACLRHGVRCVEASAFVQLTPDLVRYRVAGLRRIPTGAGVRAENRVVGKVSRPETAELFLRPAPETLTADLASRGLISAEQADLARSVPMADDITVEADSGGHTDRRPLTVLLPAVIGRRDSVAAEHPAAAPVRIGAAGGIGTPEAVVAALSLGADYIVTGSVNQAAVEADTSDGVKRLLAQAGLADCTMAPAADMFEQGVNVQVLARGSMFAGHAARLYRLYRDHGSTDELAPADRDLLEKRILRRSLEQAWQDTASFLEEHHPQRLTRAEADPKFRMAMIFRWYLAMASRWATAGVEERRGDWQIWCGPSMGAFNTWTAGSTLADPRRRNAAAIADHLLHGAGFHSRVTQLRLAGVRLPASCARYRLPTTASEPVPQARTRSDEISRQPREVLAP